MEETAAWKFMLRLRSPGCLRVSSSVLWSGWLWRSRGNLLNRIAEARHCGFASRVDTTSVGCDLIVKAFGAPRKWSWRVLISVD